MRRSSWLACAALLTLACAGSVRDRGESETPAPDAGNVTPDAGPETADAGSETPDAGTSSASACAAPGLLLCDDFEDAPAGGAPDGARWKLRIFQDAGHVAVDDTVARGGRKSVHVTAMDEGGYRSVFLTTTTPFPRPDDTFWVRFSIRSQHGMAPGHSSYFSAGDLDFQRSLRIGFNDSQLEANLTHPSAEWEVLSGRWGDTATGVRFTPGTWYCVEALYDGAHDELRTWVDGSEIAGMHTRDWNHGLTGWSPTYEQARFGFETYHGEKDELWLDDVAIGTERIGCPR